MTEQCVTLVDSSPYLASAGNVLNVRTTTYVQSATMVTSIICDTNSLGSTLQEVKGMP
jgi:hypothetical protein